MTPRRGPFTDTRSATANLRNADDFWAYGHHIVLTPFGERWTWVVHNHAYPNYGYGEQATRDSAEQKALASAELSQDRKEDWRD